VTSRRINGNCVYWRSQRKHLYLSPIIPNEYLVFTQCTLVRINALSTPRPLLSKESLTMNLTRFIRDRTRPSLTYYWS